jgi:tetratricopeptide (TPR) repeat protein
MLGNRYFIARDFEKALEQYRPVLELSKADNKIMKRVIICYIQVGQLDKALQYFFKLVDEDPAIIMNTDPYLDDCPCPEVIPEWKDKLQKNKNSHHITKALGMLYLYCDLEKAILYFSQCYQIVPQDKIIYSILQKLEHHKKQTSANAGKQIYKSLKHR